MPLNADVRYAFLSEENGHPATIELREFGFWLYIMSDLVIFSMLFATFAVLGHSYADGPTAKDLFHLPYTFVETMFLLISSLTCGMAMAHMHRNERNRVLLWLGITFLFGMGFIVMEVSEFRHMILDGNGPSRSGFLSAFFTLVSTHGLHVTVGLLWMAVMMGNIVAKGLSEAVQSRLIRFSVFWHFLDIVWVGVFTMAYLTRAL